MHVRRLIDRPIITPESDPSIGTNINGPSLVRMPDWAAGALGRYHLYFAHHHDDHIRLAYADDLVGPWTVKPGGVLNLRDTDAKGHIASPDVHVDHDRQVIRMYFHGPSPHRPSQWSYLAESADGLTFVAKPAILARFYLRVFDHEGERYGLAKRANDGVILQHRPAGEDAFVEGPVIFEKGRHVAVQRKDARTMRLVYSQAFDEPEHLLVCDLPLDGDWQSWRPSKATELLRPERDWEGAACPLEPSGWGAVHGRVNQLRDPAIYEEDGRTYLLYTVAGESGLAIAEVQW